MNKKITCETIITYTIIITITILAVVYSIALFTMPRTTLKTSIKSNEITREQVIQVLKNDKKYINKENNKEFDKKVDEEFQILKKRKTCESILKISFRLGLIELITILMSFMVSDFIKAVEMNENEHAQY